MTLISKNVYTDKLDEIVNKYNNTYHRTINTKPIDAKKKTYIDFNKENNKDGPKVKVGDPVRISKYKNIFTKGYVQNWSEEAVVIKNVKSTVSQTYFISDLNGEGIVATFYQKELQKTNRKETKLKK